MLQFKKCFVFFKFFKKLFGSLLAIEIQEKIAQLTKYLDLTHVHKCAKQDGAIKNWI